MASKTHKLTARIDRAAERVQAQLGILADLVRAIQDGAPISRQLLLCEELQGELLGVEDLVGCRTAPALF